MREFAEGDRVQIRAPLAEQRVANGELGTIQQIEAATFMITLDGGQRVAIDTTSFKHLDHGYAVTSYSSQGQSVDRVLINADTNESDLLLNQRMSYVAVSRTREDAIIYTNSAESLGEALDRQVDKQMALEAVQEVKHAALHVEADTLPTLPDRNRDVSGNNRSVGVSM